MNIFRKIGKAMKVQRVSKIWFRMSTTNILVTNYSDSNYPADAAAGSCITSSSSFFFLFFFFSPKMLFLIQIRWYGNVTHAYLSAGYPLQKSSAQFPIWGHFGSQGAKGHFHQTCYFSFRLHGMVM